jgi:hypothetical protein
MWTLKVIRKLSFQNVLLLTECFVFVLIIRVGLTLSTYNALRKLLLRGDPVEEASAADAYRIAWAVRNTARLIPKATCLTQALAGQVALSRRGLASRIKIGVIRSPEGALKAHAWLLSGHQIILGGNDHSVADFTPLAEFGSNSR